MTLNDPLTWFSRSRHSLTLNISQRATDTATVTTEGETVPKLLNGTNFNDLNVNDLTMLSFSISKAVCVMPRRRAFRDHIAFVLLLSSAVTSIGYKHSYQVTNRGDKHSSSIAGCRRGAVTEVESIHRY